MWCINEGVGNNMGRRVAKTSDVLVFGVWDDGEKRGRRQDKGRKMKTNWFSFGSYSRPLQLDQRNRFISVAGRGNTQVVSTSILFLDMEGYSAPLNLAHFMYVLHDGVANNN